MYINMQCIQNMTGIFTDGWVSTPINVDGVNILGVIVICVAFGLILGSMENEAKPMLDFLECLRKATIRLLNIALW